MLRQRRSSALQNRQQQCLQRSRRPRSSAWRKCEYGRRPPRRAPKKRKRSVPRMLLQSVRQRHRTGRRLPTLEGTFRGSHLETLRRAVRKSQPTRPPRLPLLRELRLLPDHLARARAWREEPLQHHRYAAGMNFRFRVSRHRVQQRLAWRIVAAPTQQTLWAYQRLLRARTPRTQADLLVFVHLVARLNRKKQGKRLSLRWALQLRSPERALPKDVLVEAGCSEDRKRLSSCIT